jgi:hypothetical protein
MGGRLARLAFGLILGCQISCYSYASLFALAPIDPATPEATPEAVLPVLDEIAARFGLEYSARATEQMRQFSERDPRWPFSYTILALYSRYRFVDPETHGASIGLALGSYKQTGQLVVEVWDIDNAEPTDFVLRLERDLERALTERFPQYRVEVTHERRGPHFGP